MHSVSEGTTVVSFMKNADVMVYVDGMAQITPQEPFSDKWYDAPMAYGQGLHPAIDPSFAGLIPAAAARRMSLLQKRAVATALSAMSDASLEMPDAIVTGTGAGTMKNSERFLADMIEGKGEGLSPTPFINSTHNTLAATVAITLGCKGYNTTYSHNGMSFPTALMDSAMGLESGRFGSVLLSSHDELPEHYYRLLEATGEFDGEPFAGEHSVSFVLRAVRSGHTLAAVPGVEITASAREEDLRKTAFRACRGVTGEPGRNGARQGIPDTFQGIADMIVTGDPDSSRKIFGDQVPMFPYKEVFGGGFSAPAASLYAAITFFRRNPSLNGILVHNHYKNRQHSFIFAARPDFVPVRERSGGF